MFQPCKIYFLREIKVKYFSTIPNLTTKNVGKYLMESLASTKGYLEQNYQDTRSTSSLTQLAAKPDNLQVELQAILDVEEVHLPLPPSERTNLIFILI